MSTIQHQLHISASRDQVLGALNSIEGVSSWWTRTTEGSAALGEQIGFRFGSHLTQAQVSALSDDHVEWTVVDSNPDWVGTRIGFKLAQVEDKVRLTFTHADWREQNEFFGHCSMKWATFLLSLRDQVERGAGRPFPDDLAI